MSLAILSLMLVLIVGPEVRNEQVRSAGGF